MNPIDDLRDLTRGRVRIETGPYTDEEREKIRFVAVTTLVGLLAWFVTQSPAWVFVGMIAAADLVLSMESGEE